MIWFQSIINLDSKESIQSFIFLLKIHYLYNTTKNTFVSFSSNTIIEIEYKKRKRKQSKSMLSKMQSETFFKLVY